MCKGHVLIAKVPVAAALKHFTGGSMQGVINVAMTGAVRSAANLLHMCVETSFGEEPYPVAGRVYSISGVTVARVGKPHRTPLIIIDAVITKL